MGLWYHSRGGMVKARSGARVPVAGRLSCTACQMRHWDGAAEEGSAGGRIREGMRGSENKKRPPWGGGWFVECDEVGLSAHQ